MGTINGYFLYYNKLNHLSCHHNYLFISSATSLFVIGGPGNQRLFTFCHIVFKCVSNYHVPSLLPIHTNAIGKPRVLCFIVLDPFCTSLVTSKNNIIIVFNLVVWLNTLYQCHWPT